MSYLKMDPGLTADPDCWYCREVEANSRRARRMRAIKNFFNSVRSVVEALGLNKSILEVIMILLLMYLIPDSRWAYVVLALSIFKEYTRFKILIACYMLYMSLPTIIIWMRVLYEYCFL
ncbi:uncharacterized protein LOC108606166 [Drosophila busckii]|uniref:uncharacterized protein LOC108606166 n=1 Tax=Drosophila busckii TaxID=30019 RepID=UPI00083F07A5|nr:uncharacterized protein LOC108606166 [Drosophila busckii]